MSRTVMPGFGIGNFTGQARKFLGLPVTAAGLRGKFFQQIAILLGMEILGDAVHARERQDVAAHLFIGARGGDLSSVGAGLVGGPIGVKCSRRCSDRASFQFAPLRLPARGCGA